MGENTEVTGAPDLAGYQSPEELVKAYRASSDEGKRQRQRADQLEQRLSQLEQQFSRPNVPQRNDPASQLDAIGVPVDALEQYVGGIVARAFEPLARGAQARNQLLSSYTDYQKYEADVAKFVEGDPQLNQTYQRMFSADPQGAMEFAFLKFGETKRREAPAAPEKPQAKARSEAQIPSNRAGDTRNAPSQGDEMLTKSWEHYQKTGDPRAFAKARLRQVISDDFLSR